MNEAAVRITSESFMLEPLIQRFNPEAALHVLEGADHFFFGLFEDLAAVLSRHITAP